MGVDASAVARVVGIDVAFINLRGENVALLPQQVALLGQGASAASYALTPVAVTSAFEVGTTFGFGSPVHLAALQLLPPNADGLGSIPLTVYPFEDEAASAPSDGDITPAGAHVGAASYQIIINGISSTFVLVDGDVVADAITAIVTAVNANLNMPMIAVDNLSTTADLTSKWAGTSANDLAVSIVGPTQGITFGFTQPVGGLVNPDVNDQLSNITNKWETMLVNCLEYTDTTALDAYSTWGDGRWAVLQKTPAVVFTATTEPTFATLQTAGDLRKFDRTNSLVAAPDAEDLPCQIAARAVARVARQANNNPPVDYGGAELTNLHPGPDTSQFTYPQRNLLVQAGIATTEVRNGLIVLSDTITFHHPDGQLPPAYRYVVDIVKLQNIIFNLDLIFESPEWEGKPLLLDEDPTTNPEARKPKDAKAEVNGMIDALGLVAILINPAAAKLLTTAVIDSGNPKRLNIALTVQLSGNVNIISIDLNFGFLFGTADIIAA